MIQSNPEVTQKCCTDRDEGLCMEMYLNIYIW